MFSKVKLGLVLLGVSALGSMILLGYRHYSNLVEHAETLAADKARLEEDLAVQSATIDSLRVEAEAQEGRLQEQSEVATRASAEARRLNAIFSEHDLTRLALAKPALVERRANDGAARAGRLLACTTTPGCDRALADQARGAAIAPADPAAGGQVEGSHF